MDFLIQSFEEHSILWILVSTFVGALIGSSFKFIFDTIATTSYGYRVSSKRLMRAYQYPLLHAADSLDRRLENMIKFIDEKWCDDPDDDYYRISTLYLFGMYFGWCMIFELMGILGIERSDKKTREFSKHFYNVFKGLTGYHYFEKVSDGEISGIFEAYIPRFALTAIGELMIKKEPEERSKLPRLLGFVEFYDQINKSEQFKRWFSYIEKRILCNHSPSKSSAKWNRLLVFATTLRVFLAFLDPKGRLTKKRKINYLHRIHHSVSEQLMKDIQAAKMDKLVELFPAPSESLS